MDPKKLNADPLPGIPDEEHRWLVSLASCLLAAQTSAMRVADARERRGCGCDDLLRLQDELLEMRAGIDRAIKRRVRDLGPLVQSPFRSLGGVA